MTRIVRAQDGSFKVQVCVLNQWVTARKFESQQDALTHALFLNETVLAHHSRAAA